jgi:hypothetical protein
MLARVMVEGEDSKLIRTIAHEIGAAIQKNLGAQSVPPPVQAKGRAS